MSFKMSEPWTHSVGTVGENRRRDTGSPCMRSTLIILLLTAVPASAAESRWGLRWRAPDECIGPADLAAKVEQRLGRSVFGGTNPDFRVDGVVEAQAQAPKWKARVTVVSAAGDVLGSREVTGNESCRALDERLAFVVAVSIDPTVGVGEPAPATPLAVAPTAPVAPPKEAPRQRAPGAVWVELETDNPRVTLFRHVGTSYGAMAGRSMVVTTIEKQCEAPCNDFIENPKSDFFISGSGITVSSSFTLSKYPDGLKLKVRPGSAGLRFFGWSLATLGTVSAILGGTFALVMGLLSAPPQPGVQNPYGGASNVLRDVGWGCLIGGAAAIAAGIPMIAFSSTKLEFFPATAPVQPVPSNVTEI
jgi:hypothetical protein